MWEFFNSLVVSSNEKIGLILCVVLALWLLVREWGKIVSKVRWVFKIEGK